MECLEKLRIRLSKDIKHLPPTLQKNEEWVKNTIENRLFKGIDVQESLPLTALETLKKNYLDSMPILQDTVNQCLFSAI
ncbi:MAG: hypothetical protein MUF15_24755 [Acidobacteria bacterium]|nr:hypothetical protein [Acidobacteriota bacterium]